MSDASSVQPTSEAQTSADPTLTARRILAFAIAIALGFVTIGAGIILILKTGLDATVPISFVEIPLLPLAAFPMAMFFLIWVDYFMKTKIVVD